jgi:hypothetical protein
MCNTGHWKNLMVRLPYLKYSATSTAKVFSVSFAVKRIGEFWFSDTGTFHGYVSIFFCHSRRNCSFSASDIFINSIVETGYWEVVNNSS